MRLRILKRRDNLRRVAASFLILACSAVSGQTRVDASHAQPPTGRRNELSDLSHSVQGQLPPASTAPVKRRNFIDDFIFGKMERDKIPHAGLCSDTEFLRRVSLDLTGRL